MRWKEKNMKVKHVIASVALSFAMGFGALAGLMASKEAKAAKADDPKTWMMAVSLNMSEPDNWGAALSELQVVVKGSDFETWHAMHETGVEHWWTVNIPFTDAQEVTEYGFGFTQAGEGGGWKASKLVSTSQSKASHVQHLARTTVGMDWDGGSWVSQNVSGVGTGENLLYSLEKTGETSPTSPLKEEPEKNRFIAEGLEALTDWDYNFGLDFAGLDIYEMVKDEDMSLLSTYADDWIQFKNAGTYDVILGNEYSDGGIFSVKQYGEVETTYIYYLSESNFGDGATPNSIYTYGGSEQFGAWPGSLIADVATEVTGKGVLRFDGVYGVMHDQSQYIYKIPVQIGYPQDSYVMINYQGSDKGAEQELVAHCAYQWSARNLNKGLALDFLLKVEEKRNAVAAEGNIKQYSVCGISKDDAKDLYTEYQTICTESVAVRNAINDSFIYTYNEDKSAGNEMVPLTHVMERIGIIAGLVEDPNASRFGNIAILSDNKAIVIISIASCTALAFTFFFVFKKKKQQ